MTTVQKPSSTLSKDMKTYFFPLICCNCGTWFPSLGDIKFHFNVCSVLHRYFQCGHCALLFTNWHSFVAHINTKDMVSAKPVTDHFSWQKMKKWQNPLKNQHSDILHVAMQHSGLHSTNPQPTVDLSLNLSLDSMLVTTTNNVSVQTSPLVSESNILSSTYTHVQALLQLNIFLAQLISCRQVASRLLSDSEKDILKLTISQNIWPHSFLSCTTMQELHTAIVAWLYQQI